METINDKAMQAISTFLDRRGYDILERNWTHGKDSIDFIARDKDGELVFIAAKVASKGNTLPAEKANRKSLERVAAAYLAGSPSIPEGPIRFDAISLLVLGPDKALIRHHINAIGDAGTTEV